MKIVFTLVVFGFSLGAAAKSVDYESGGQTYEGYVLSAGKSKPTVLILHDWDGLTDYEIKRAEMLKKLGYSVFSADLFGKGVRPTEIKDRREHTGALYKDRKKMRQLMMDALKAAEKAGLNTKKIAVMGYCFGGAAALEFARSGEGAAGVFSFHGGLETPEGQDYKNTQTKVFIYHGTADSAIPMSSFASLADELEKANVRHEMHSYGGALHGFTVFDGHGYQKEADQKSWASFNTALKEIF